MGLWGGIILMSGGVVFGRPPRIDCTLECRYGFVDFEHVMPMWLPAGSECKEPTTCDFEVRPGPNCDRGNLGQTARGICRYLYVPSPVPYEESIDENE